MTATEAKDTKNPLKKNLFDFEFESDDDEEPELGSTAMFEAIFKNAKRGGGLSSKDVAKVNEDVAKILNKPTRSKKSRTPKKKRKMEKETKRDKKVEHDEDDDEELNLSQESRDLMKSCRDLLKDSESEDEEEQTIKLPSQTPSHFTSTDANTDQTTNDNAEEEYEIAQSIAKTRQEHGELILCQVVFQGKKYPLKIFENQTVAELRAQIFTKTGADANDWLDLYHGNCTLLDDRMQVKEYGIKCLDDIDAFVQTKTEKEIFIAGSDTVMRFKLQTDDRRGRSASHVYVKRTGTMREAVVKYCEEFGLDSSKVRLKFDGDIISLDATPVECDLEGDECIDVIVSE